MAYVRGRGKLLRRTALEYTSALLMTRKELAYNMGIGEGVLRDRARHNRLHIKEAQALQREIRKQMAYLKRVSNDLSREMVTLRQAAEDISED